MVYNARAYAPVGDLKRLIFKLKTKYIMTIKTLKNEKKQPIAYDALLPAVLFHCDDNDEIEYRGYNGDFIKHLENVWENDNESQIELSDFGGKIKDIDGTHDSNKYYLSLAKIEEWTVL